MLWLILGFSWLASVTLILSLLGVVREREHESLAGASIEPAWPSSFHISNGRASISPPVNPSRRVA